VIKRLLLRTGKKYYKIAVAIYLGDILLKAIEKADNPQELNDLLRGINANEDSPPEPWYDLAGMLVSKSRLEACINTVCHDKTNSVEKLLSIFEKAAEAYEEDNLIWWAQLIRKQFGVLPKDLNKEQLSQIIQEWKTNSLKLNNMILKDAEKEFDPTSRIGYGLDGDSEIQKADFETVRGNYDNNKFVKELNQEKSKIETRANKALQTL
jgi:hypothetical protein